MLGPRIMDWYATSLEKGLAAREHISPDRYFDYGFKDFIADPRATVQGIYDHLQLPMEEATRQAIEDHIARNAKGKHGKHEYDLQRYGLTEQQVRDRYKFYLDNNSLV
jgi:sulfotransferase family protein